LLTTGHDTASALTGGYRLAFSVSAGLVVAGIAVAAVVLRAGPDKAGAGP
jgi:hypothetical protein